MKCEAANELLSDYVSGDIEPALAVSFENHLATCSDCRESVSNLKSLWSSLDDLPIVEPPAFFHENLMSRINAAVNAQEEAEAKKHATFDWRTLFRPRSLAYAASVLALLLAGMGGLHYTKAALDPVGALLHLMQPKPVNTLELSSSRAEWVPNAQGTGSLIVYLKAQADPDGKSNTLKCVLNLPADTIPQGTKTDAVISSETEASISVPMKAKPSRSEISVTISSVNENSASNATRTVPVTLMEPIDPPAK